MTASVEEDAFNFKDNLKQMTYTVDRCNRKFNKFLGNSNLEKVVAKRTTCIKNCGTAENLWNGNNLG